VAAGVAYVGGAAGAKKFGSLTASECSSRDDFVVSSFRERMGKKDRPRI
jgi:hypothetical protein